MKIIVSVLIWGLAGSFVSYGATYYLNSTPGPFPSDPYNGTMPIVKVDAVNQVYLIEDAPGDLAASQTLLAAYMGLALDTNQISANGDMRPKLDTTKLYVNSLTLSGSTLHFDVRNLVPGDDYLIAREKVLDRNFTNYWAPEWILTAPSVNVGLSIPLPTDSPDGFYQLVDYSQYQGPALRINSPSDNSTNSGVIQANCSLMDIFQPLAVELYIDGILWQKISSGPITFDVDTRKLANGPHIFTVVLSSLIPYNDTAFETSYATNLQNVVTENPFVAVNMPSAFTASLGAIPYQFQTTAPAVCSLIITDTNGLPIRTLWATNDSPGTFEIDWDLTRDDATPVDVPGSYFATATATPKPNGQAQPEFIWPPLFVPVSLHPGLHAGKTGVFRAALASSGDEDWQQSLALDISGSIDEACIVHPSDADGFPRNINVFAMPKIFTSDSDLLNFFAITTNASPYIDYTGHVIWIGHASGTDFGAGHGTLITETISEHQIRDAYGNGYDPVSGIYWFGVGGKRGRIRYTEIDGCHSATSVGDMCVAFGTPKNFNSNPNLERSAYCGWNDLIYLDGGWPFRSTPESRHVDSLQSFWSAFGIDTPTIGVSSLEAFYYYGDDAYISKFVIEGSSSLRWQNGL